MAAGLAAVALALVAAACGGDGDDGAAPAPDSATRITVQRFDGERTAGETTLDCAGADRAACARLVALLPALVPAPDEVCTEIYGGPERIVIDAVVAGTRSRTEVTRTNGCEIARYERVEAALSP